MTSLCAPELDGANDIYNIVIDCTTLFESLAERAKMDHGEKDIKAEKGEQEDGQMAFGDQTSSSKLSTNEMEKSFNLWIDYTGALAADVSRSLDTRLYAHRDIKEMVTDLLQMLARNLEYLDKGDNVKPDVPSSSNGNNSDMDELEDEARYAIQRALDELHFMAAAIRKSSVRSQKYNLSSSFYQNDDSYFQEQACLLVRYYFRDSRRSLCDQLGASLAMRHSKFLRRMRHEEKLSTRRSPEESKHLVKFGKGPVSGPQQPNRQTDLPKQKPIVRFKAPLGSADTGSQLDSVIARRRLKQGPALSAISRGSSIRLSSAIYPDKPKFADGDKDCACPYCARRLMTIRLRNEPKYWQNHMDEDTEPYVCLSEDCTSPMLFFVHMKDWMNHMEIFHSDQWNRKIHMSTWYCDIGHKPAIQFDDHESFVRHMKDPVNHEDREPPTDRQLDTLSRNKQKILFRDDEYCCPICECVPSSLEPVISNSSPNEIRRQLYEHIAAHIKDLAFKSIPALDEAGPSEYTQSEVDDGDHRRLRGDNSVASYLSNQVELRQETSVAFADNPDRDTVGLGDEVYNEDFYNMDGLNTLWDNPELVEYWERKVAPDPGRLDDILDHFARTQQHDERLASPTESLVRSVKDTLRMHIADSNAKLDVINGNSLVVQLGQMPFSAVATAGLEMMNFILEGHQAASPLDILCFIHVIFSLSLVIHEQDAAKYSAALFKQALLDSHWFSDDDKISFIEVVYTLWKPSEVSDDEIISLLKSSSPFPIISKGKQFDRFPSGPRPNPLILIAAYFLDELEYMTLCDNNFKEQASQLVLQHLKDNLTASNHSPFSIAAKFMIENVFFHDYSHFPGFGLSMEQVMNQLNSGGVGNVRRLELELMQAGKTYLPSDVFFNEFIEVVRRQTDSLYTQSRFFSSRSTYYRCGIQLMKSLISEPDRSSAVVPVGTSVESSGLSTETLDATMGGMFDGFDFEP